MAACSELHAPTAADVRILLDSLRVPSETAAADAVASDLAVVALLSAAEREACVEQRGPGVRRFMVDFDLKEQAPDQDHLVRLALDATSAIARAGVALPAKELVVFVYAAGATVHRRSAARPFHCVRFVWPDICVDTLLDAKLWLLVRASCGCPPSRLRGETEGRPKHGQQLPLRACRRLGYSFLEGQPHCAPAVLVPPLMPALVAHVALQVDSEDKWATAWPHATLIGLQGPHAVSRQVWASVGSFGSHEEGDLLGAWPFRGRRCGPAGARHLLEQLLFLGYAVARKLHISGPPDWWVELVMPLALDPADWETRLLPPWTLQLWGGRHWFVHESGWWQDNLPLRHAWR